MRKALFLFMVFGLVGLMCGSTSGQSAEVEKIVTKLKETGNCIRCTLTGADLKGANLKGADLTMAYLYKADLTGANLTGADLTEATMKDIKNLNSAIQCKTIMPWGEENSGC